MPREITTKDLIDYFGYRRVTGDDASLNRKITEMAINRPGFELSGNFLDYSRHRIVIIGRKEHTFIQTMPVDQQRKAFEFLTDEAVPCIIISTDLPCPDILKEIAQRKNFPIFSTYAPTSSLTVELYSFLEERFAVTESVHGVLLKVFGRGVLITGDSGIGKSEVALELIKKGQVLIADDRVEVYRYHNTVIGKAPRVLRGMLELRGVGIIDIERIYGISATDKEAEIDCVIELRQWQEDFEYDRLGMDDNLIETIHGVNIPKLIVPVREGRSVAPIIEAAMANILLKQKGYNSGDVLRGRVSYLISRHEEEKGN